MDCIRIEIMLVNHCLRGSNRRKRGFTGLTLIVTITAMVLVVGATLPSVAVVAERTRETESSQELNLLKAAVESFFRDTGVLPAALSELTVNGAGRSGWVGPYLNPDFSALDSEPDSVAQDAWDRDYLLTVNGASGLEIRSRGRDGTADTADDLVTSVNVEFLRRASTLAELKIINNSIAAYNTTFLEVDPLSGDWSQIFLKLKNTAYLPMTIDDLDTDDWGDAYISDPIGANPVTSMTSSHLD